MAANPFHVVTEVFTIVESSTSTTAASRGEDGADDPGTEPASDSEFFPAVEALGKHAPYMVAFHQNDTIIMIGLCTEESARATYDAVANKFSKVVVDRRRSQVLESSGPAECVKLCQERISHMDAFNGNTPLQYASYVVAFHQVDCVKMIGFSKEGSARAVCNALSDEWSSILIDRRQHQDLRTYRDARYISECKEEVLLLPLFENPISLSENGTYIVAFHQKDCVRMIGLSTLEAARTLYDALSEEWAKILMDIRRPSPPLASYGGASYTEQCQEAFRGLDALNSTTLMTASYIVAFHRENCVRMLGFSEEKVARAMYSAVGSRLSKVLMVKYSSKLLASHGSASYIRQCKEEVLRLW